MGLGGDAGRTLRKGIEQTSCRGFSRSRWTPRCGLGINRGSRRTCGEDLSPHSRHDGRMVRFQGSWSLRLVSCSAVTALPGAGVWAKAHVPGQRRSKARDFMATAFLCSFYSAVRQAKISDLRKGFGENRSRDAHDVAADDLLDVLIRVAFLNQPHGK